MTKQNQNRRDFLRKSIIYSGAVFLGCKGEKNHYSHLQQKQGSLDKSKVIISKDALVKNDSGIYDSGRILKMLDKSMMNLTSTDRPEKAWQTIISSNDKVSLKLNCLAGIGLSTNQELVDSIIYRLQEIGVKNENLIVWERMNDDFERAGYKVITDKNKVRFLGNDLLGYSNDFYFLGEVGSLLSKAVTEFSDVIINLPVLKDHGIVGASIGMKNMFGAIHNPNKYHLNIGDPYVADVNAIPVIKNKVRLIICDALKMQYEGGPPFQSQFAVDYNSILVGTDPVSLDYIGWKIIEEKRKENGLLSLNDAGREPKYIYTAADENHKLGNVKEEMIEIVSC
jgi:uncharacterized protein (DUF362 family)